jgi:hypothetical protein
LLGWRTILDSSAFLNVRHGFTGFGAGGEGDGVVVDAGSDGEAFEDELPPHPEAVMARTEVNVARTKRRRIYGLDVETVEMLDVSRRLLRQCVRAGHDLEDLLRDLRLSRAVHLQRERVDQLARVLRRVAHGGHAGALLGRG